MYRCPHSYDCAIVQEAYVDDRNQHNATDTPLCWPGLSDLQIRPSRLAANVRQCKGISREGPAAGSLVAWRENPGCGLRTGTLAILAKEQVGMHSVRSDTSPEMIACAAKNAKRAGVEIVLEHGLAESLPCPACRCHSSYRTTYESAESRICPPLVVACRNRLSHRRTYGALCYVVAQMRLPAAILVGVIVLVAIKHLGLFSPAHALFRRWRPKTSGTHDGAESATAERISSSTVLCILSACKP